MFNIGDKVKLLENVRFFDRNTLLKDSEGIICGIIPGAFGGTNFAYIKFDKKEPFNSYLSFSVIELVGIKNKTCECGKDKHGFAKHSVWCQKSEQYMDGSKFGSSDK